MLHLRSSRALLRYWTNCIPKKNGCFILQKVFATVCVREKNVLNNLTWSVDKYKISCIHISSAYGGKVIPFLLSDIGEGITEVQIKEWYIKEGDVVKQYDEICEVQSDKATVTITSRYDGVIQKVYYEVDDLAKVGSPLVDIYDEHAEIQEDKIPLQAETVLSETFDKPKMSATKLLVAPAVRKIASDNNIDVNIIQGTGKDGRILKEDILQYLKGVTSNQNKQLSTETADKTVKVTGYKCTMVKTMTKSGSIPQFSYCDEIRMDALIRLRKMICEKPGCEKITFLPFMIKALSHALTSHPELNAVLSDDANYITYKEAHNIGVAVDTQIGLIVPNIKSVQVKNVLEVSSELNRLTELAQLGKLRPDDISDGTFTLSNIGAIGGTYTKPLLLPPEVAIGGFGKIQTVPKYTETGELIRGHVMHVSWSADHRVIDGALLAKFSNLWRLYIENPEMLILELK